MTHSFPTRRSSDLRMAPRDLRRRPTARHAHAGEHLTLRLGYRPPYDLESMLGFLRGRALPGVEHVGDDSYARVIAGDGAGAPPGWLDRKSTRLNSSH